MNWIKVSDGLPEKPISIVVWFDDEKYWHKAVYDYTEGEFFDMKFNHLTGVTHWAYIEPPKEQS